MDVHVEPIFGTALSCPQPECEAAKIGRGMGILWGKTIDSHESEFDSLRTIFTGCKMTLAVEPAQSLAGVLAKLAVARDTINDAFDGPDQSATTKKAQHGLLHLLLDDAMRCIEKKAGVTTSDMGLDIH